MAVAFDIFSASALLANTASITWSHDPSGTPRGVLVFVMTDADADHINSVTYDSVALTQVAEARDQTTEPQRCTAFYLDSASLTSSAVTVAISRTNNAVAMWGCSITVTAGNETEVHLPSIILFEGNGTLAEQAVTDGSPGTNSTRFAGIFSGLPSAPSAGANSTLVTNQATARGNATVVRQTTPNQGIGFVGFTSPTDDDRAAIHLAVREIPTVPVIHPINRAGNGATGR